MTDSYDTLTLVGRHVPDAMVNAQGVQASPQELGYDTINPVTGTYEIGALIDGQFVPMISEKASLIFDKVQAAKDAAAAQEQAAPAATDPGAPVAPAAPADPTQPQG